ncbi:carboxypeptidase-like regulatory domain-containing protein [Trinickia mobilis]|uniref:carboxypeptidase-like regulatory domain-containing protein n=1 Tax=Trinickia mobilis TaxID=2816356 RepID=UPI001F5C0B13|nr:carboxypeptidase-like regulatory domain-containing protein [Trinickia mobilis]
MPRKGNKHRCWCSMEKEMKLRLLSLISAAAILAAGTSQIATAATPALPPLQHSGSISYLSGGVGSDQSAAIKNVMHQYPLTLEFVGKTNSGNEYLADVPVQIADAHGTTVLKTDAQGPFMLLSLPDGRYTVTARHDGKMQRRTVNIASSTRAHEMFIWAM